MESKSYGESGLDLFQKIGVMPKKIGKILDVGCGRGDIVNFLIKAGYDVYGCDIDKTAIEEGIKQGLLTKERIFDKGYEDEDIKNNKFDTLIFHRPFFLKFVLDVILHLVQQESLSKNCEILLNTEQIQLIESGQETTTGFYHALLPYDKMKEILAKEIELDEKMCSIISDGIKENKQYYEIMNDIKQAGIYLNSHGEARQLELITLRQTLVKKPQVKRNAEKNLDIISHTSKHK